jgi:hypothetical protein
MADWWTNTIGPAAPIVGAIAGAIIGAVVTLYFVLKRKRVAFYVTPSEDITIPLQQHKRHIGFKLGDRELLNLNRGSVLVVNRGNTAIQDFTFDIVINGDHQFAAAELNSDDVKLVNAVKIVDRESKQPYDPIFHVSIPFLNPGESFEVVLFFDGTTNDCQVYCRMEDMKFKVVRAQKSDVLDLLGSTSIKIGLLGLSLTIGPSERKARRRR